MDDQIFRKKSLDRMSSPDALHNTIIVTRPAVWLLLVALVLVFVGFLVWAVFGTLDSTVDTVVTSKEDSIGCYISEYDVQNVEKGMEVAVGAQTYELGSQVDDKSCFAKDADEYAAYLGEFDDMEYLYYYTVLGNVPSGTHKGKIITERINAISFLWN